MFLNESSKSVERFIEPPEPHDVAKIQLRNSTDFSEYVAVAVFKKNVHLCLLKIIEIFKFLKTTYDDIVERFFGPQIIVDNGIASVVRPYVACCVRIDEL